MVTAMVGGLAPIGDPEERTSTRRLGYVPALDGLRGVAITLVLLDHIFFLLGVRSPLPGAVLGVDLFFVLSGFLITSLLLSEQLVHRTVRFGSFYARRAVRLLPPLYVMLLAHLVYSQATHDPANPLRTELHTIRDAVLYVSNWSWKWDREEASGLGHLWSLAIEEQFYLAWPVVVVLFLGVRRNLTAVTATLLALIAAVFVRRLRLHDQGMGWILIYLRTDTRADSLLVGALLAQLRVRRRTPTRGAPVLAWIGTLGFLVFLRIGDPTAPFLNRGGYLVVAVSAALIVMGVADGRWVGAKALARAPLRGLGRISYGLYLWHMPVFFAVARYGVHSPRWERLLVGLAITFAATLASWKFVEQPVLRLRRRFPFGASSSQTAEP
jgi:peptidoglycan/LPS O-acetylase OafA/YrhL